MEYSRIRKAIDREIVVKGCSSGKFVKIPNGFLNLVIFSGNLYTIELEILNKKIFSIKSFVDSNTYQKNFRVSIENDDWLALFFKDSALNNSFDVAIRYGTAEGLIFDNPPAMTNPNDYPYKFGELHLLQDTSFKDGNADIFVDQFSVGQLDVNSITSNSTTFNLNNKNISAGNLEIHQASLDVADVDVFNAKTLTTDTLSIGNWKLEKDGNNSITISYNTNNN